MRKILLTITCLLLCFPSYSQLFSGTKGEITLKGEAPLEVITAKSNTLKGKIDATTRKFNFRQTLTSFSFSQGDMQKKDAEDMYWETDKYPYASFRGIILNAIDLTKDGTYHVTSKGTFTLHGVSKEMKINGVLTVKNGSIDLKSTFKIYLTDFKIKIPRLMIMKVSEEFEVAVSLNLTHAKL